MSGESPLNHVCCGAVVRFISKKLGKSCIFYILNTGLPKCMAPWTQAG